MRAGHGGNEAAVLNSIGGVYNRVGDRRLALAFYEQSLPITREAGDRAGEAVTRYSIATIHRAEGDLDQAITELERVVDLDHQVGHPDLESDTAFLEQVRQERAQRPQRNLIRRRSPIQSMSDVTGIRRG